MNIKVWWIVAISPLTLPLLALAPAVITMDQEPHHHFALHNDYVKVFEVEASPGDSIVLHRHDQDTVAIAVGDQFVSVGVSGKPDVHQKNSDAQVRPQRGGSGHGRVYQNSGDREARFVEILFPRPAKSQTGGW